MLYDEFVGRLETILGEMDDVDYLELVKNMELDDAHNVYEMSELDDVFDGFSPSELMSLFEDNSDAISTLDDYFIYDGYSGTLHTTSELRYQFDVDDVMRIIIETKRSFDNEEIQELLDDFATLDETEALDKIIEALDDEEEVKLVISGTEYVVERKKTVEKEKTEE